MKKLLISTGAASLLLLAACGGSDASATLASDITSALPTQYADKAGSSGTASVTAMNCSETGDTQAYTCVGTVAISGGTVNETDQVIISANWDPNSDTGTWQVTQDTPQG